MNPLNLKLFLPGIVAVPNLADILHKGLERLVLWRSWQRHRSTMVEADSDGEIDRRGGGGICSADGFAFSGGTTAVEEGVDECSDHVLFGLLN